MIIGDKLNFNDVHNVRFYPEDDYKKPKLNMKLFCSDRNSLQPAGVRFIFSASCFGLVYNHEKLGILNYHKDLVLQWLKGSKQLLCT